MNTIYGLLHPEEEVLVEARISPFPVLRGFYILLIYALVCSTLIGVLLTQTNGLSLNHFTAYYDFMGGFEKLTDYISASYPHLSIPANLLQILTIGPVSVLIVASCIAYAIYGFILRIKSELVVTNLRVIAKLGWLARDVAELHHHTVQDLFLSQSLLGRIFNYGTISIRGYAGSIAKVPFVSDPFYFRTEALEEIEQMQQNHHPTSHDDQSE